MTATIRGADLFCGAGGSSSGLLDAADDLGLTVDLLAINHWDVAIATHSKNLPGARHVLADVASVDPRVAVPGGRLDILWASPECKQHSTARGGRPINDQKRADPWQVIRWAAELYIRCIAIENVPEFRAWGPIDARGRPIKSRRGETYQAFLSALRNLGYAVEDKLLVAADYGDPTTRKRLFILARRDGLPIRWPAPTHARPGQLLPGLKPWRVAREVIDWAIPGESIFGRKRPLARNTMQRIIAGLQKFGGPEMAPFLVVLRGTDPYHLQNSAKPIELPLPALCATANHIGLAQPFLLGQQSGSVPRSVTDPVPTVATDGAIALVQPFILPPLGVHHRGGKANKARSVDDPLQTVTSRGGGHLVQPFIVGTGGPERAGKPQSVDAPMGTLLTRNHRALVQPFIVPRYSERKGQKPRTHSLDEPMPTVPASCQHALVEPFIVQVDHGSGLGRGNGGRVRSVDEPLRTVTASGNGQALVEPFIIPVNHGAKGERHGRARSTSEPLPAVTASRRSLALIQAMIAKYYGTGIAKPVTEPLDAVTTKDRFGLVTFGREGLALDIRFRMLEPHELARAQGFADTYTFTGTKGERVTQIGNAVPRETAKAICMSLLADRAPKRRRRRRARAAA